jgi:hypothetical protein
MQSLFKVSYSACQPSIGKRSSIKKMEKKYFFLGFICISSVIHKKRRFIMKAKNFSILFVIIFVAVFFPLRSKAADDGLYAAAPPQGSAFVRFVNGDPTHLYKGNIRGKEFPSVAPGHAGAYLPISQGEGRITFGENEITYNFKSGVHYSAVLAGGHLGLLEEPANNNKLKTQIILINASSQKNVSLKTPDGSISVIDSVDPSKLGVRPVNPVKTGFTVYSSGNKIASLTEQSLERGASYAVIVYDSAKGPAANYDKATGS